MPFSGDNLAVASQTAVSGLFRLLLNSKQHIQEQTSTAATSSKAEMASDTVPSLATQLPSGTGGEHD